MPAVLLALALFFVPATAAAQIRSLELRTPQAFGYFIGDVIRHEIDAVVDEPYELRTASLPSPQPLSYWLDLVDVDVESTTSDGARRYVIRLTYQTFYAPLAASRLEIPPVRLTFADGSDVIERSVPAWPFVSSSLRGFQAEVTGGTDFIRPDIRPRLHDLSRDRGAFALFAAFSLLAAGGLMHHWALWPFGGRPARPFTRAARGLRRTWEGGGREEDADYRSALLVMHRAFDEAAGRRLFREDLPLFLESHPAFHPLDERISTFFEASRRAFFSDDWRAARAHVPLAEIRKLAESLSRAERRAR